MSNSDVTAQPPLADVFAANGRPLAAGWRDRAGKTLRAADAAAHTPEARAARAALLDRLGAGPAAA